MLHFLTPIAFSGLALALPILLLYLLKLRRSEIPVSSNFLWQQVLQDAEANAPWQRLRRNFLLFLQLLLLAALVFTLARPYTIVPAVSSGKLALLIDASASMNATDAAEGTRMAAAKQQALAIIDTMNAGDRVMLVRVASLAEIILPYSNHRDQLRGAISSLTAGAGTADWQSALALATADRHSETAAERIVILSDGGFGEISALPGGQESEWEYIPIGNSAENVAISQLATRSLGAERPQLFASLTNYGQQDAERILSLWLDENLHHSERISIAAGSAQPFLYELPSHEHQELELRLTVPLAAQTPDHFPADDRAYAATGNSSAARALLISQNSDGSDRNIFLERAISSIPGWEVLRGNPSLGIPSLITDLTVLDGWLPEEGLPEGDLLLIQPPRSTPLFERGEAVAIHAPLRADEQHPITQFVDLSNVSLLTAQEFTPLFDWAQTIIWADSVPLLLAGEQQNRRIALLTFDLQDSDLPLWIAWPILVANLLEWFRWGDLADAEHLNRGELALFSAPLAADTARITGPDGDLQLLPVTSPTVAFQDTESTGLYRLEWLAGEQVIRSDAFAINSFQPQESDIRPREAVQFGDITLSQSETDALGQREWWSIAATIALVLLVGEWWLYHHRNRLPKRVPAGAPTSLRQRIFPGSAR